MNIRKRYTSFFGIIQSVASTLEQGNSSKLGCMK